MGHWFLRATNPLRRATSVSTMANTASDQIASINRSLDRELSKHAFFLQAERRTGVRKTHLVYLAVAIVLGYFVLRWAADVALALVAFAYPALMTVKAIEGSDKREHTHWMAYWLCLSFWSTVESLTGGLFPAIVPMYTVLKLAACLWLFLPRTRGATVLYEHAIHPIAQTLLNHPVVQDAAEQLRKSSEHFASSMNKTADDVSQTAKRFAEETSKRAERAEESAKNAADKINEGIKKDE